MLTFLMAAREAGAKWEVVWESPTPLAEADWIRVSQDFERAGFPYVALTTATQVSTALQAIEAREDGSTTACHGPTYDVFAVSARWREHAKATLATLYRGVEAGRARLRFPQEG